LTSTATLYKSGSTLFGDTADDTHNFSGSVYQSGSMSYNGYVIDKISNDTSFTDGSSTYIVTENAVKYFIDNSALFIDRQQYVRKNYNKTASSISNNTASFSAVTASAGSLTATNEGDYLFFNNGQIMEHDALTIQQSGSTFLLIVDPSSIGYNLDSLDEIKAWGKFNA
jgi:citrate synthase